VRTGMVFNVSVGMQDLKINSSSGEENTYALLLADTVEVEKTGGRVLTDAKKLLADISYTLEVAFTWFFSDALILLPFC